MGGWYEAMRAEEENLEAERINEIANDSRIFKCSTDYNLEEYAKDMEEKSFTKFDTGKTMYDLIPPKSLALLAEILTEGAEKYGANNWRKCKDLSRYRNALMRHYESYRQREFLDHESGKPHLAHCLCNIMFLLELELEREL